MGKVKLVRDAGASASAPVWDGMQRALFWGIDLVVCIYCFIMVAVLPFYSSQGYGRIGSDKYEFFKKISMYSAAFLLPLLGLYLIIHIVGKIMNKSFSAGGMLRACRQSLSFTDICALCYGAAALVSYGASEFREEALWGTKGWYMGLATQLTLVAVYFLISHMWKRRDWLAGLFLPVSAAVFTLGLLNRFGVYPFPMEAANPSFISTIGNINWYCGYLVTVFFGGVFLLWNGAGLRGWVRGLLTVYAAVGFASLATQGSSSGILALASVFFTLFLLSAADEKKMKAFLEIVIVFSAACLAVCMVRILFPGAITYTEGTTDLLTLSPVPAALALLAGGLRLAAGTGRKQRKYPVKFFRLLGRICCFGAVSAAVLCLVLLVMNTLRPGSIGPLSGIPAFTFSPAWGSNRGATWKAGFLCFAQQGFPKLLVGVGPDCMSAYLYSSGNDTLLNLVRGTFGDARLTNAHNEWLTILVNTGILGFTAYGAMVVSAVVRFLKKGSTSLIAGACGLCVLAYTVNNVVSFQQSMSTVTMFLILGIGEAYTAGRLENGGIAERK